MLSDAFIDWWFSPWRYAAGGPALPALAADPLAERDQYGDWCAAAGLRADMPGDFDPGWQVAAVDTAHLLRRAAALFGGLVAARAQDQPVLGHLSIADRRWCMSIALTQPLKGCGDVPFHPGDPVEVRGLTELARRVEHGFPGIWARLRLSLPEPLADRVDTLLPAAPAFHAATAASELRVQRCWQLCHARAASHGAA
ncbi:hypothetical protein [Pseudoduganella namucuonensis]|uniref:Uncharacterized protein n=1 Tax=Pseudoduganella namucuonensis TaxID=1035707 RepID=A0A1I7LW71_9BURK|nr:hypothetical protein [Pseudoduganella namucuonensis]SFV13953.1 hypothetical protein SAMN05216552_104054 [Pseudoduganella namucuonensis]